MRLIYDDDAIYELKRAFPADDFGKIIRCISRTPTADVPERNVGKWIPVAERLPRKRSNILVTDFNSVVEAYYYSDGNWWDLLGTELKGVTAWMLTPKPYRKETEDEQS